MSSPFHQALERNRDRYNAQFALARHRTRSLSATEFLDHLRAHVGPVVDASGVDDPVPLTDALVSLSLRLAERGWLTEGTPTARAFAALPMLAWFVGHAPTRVPAAVLNAARTIDAAPRGQLGRWLGAMVRMAGVIPPDRTDLLLDAGAVAAWRCGVALLRRSALAALRGLPADVAAVALGDPVDGPTLQRLAADPWAAPAGGEPGLLVRERVGAFTGFGGPFPRPPVVRAVDGRWYAEVSERAWEVAVDRFGWDLRRVPAVPAGAAAGSSLRFDGVGEVSDGRGGVLRLPELAATTSVAGIGDTLAVTTRYSHRIVFVGRSA
ncbi:serine/threonine-protein kinase [Actinokineospora pegani]|uniref:hypothetical protein n=1 Tax=Actinokineospora pegani TaxID=2654637 RepID=UPI0012EABA43|nr:hypothetical protein [Actinokineospora pegani]